MGLDAIIDQHLDVAHIGAAPHYFHLTSARLRNQPPKHGFNASAMMEEMLDCLYTNSKNPSRSSDKGPSQENWRRERRLNISEANTSAEKQLEKAIAKAGGDSWANQVPTASGLFDGTMDRHRNVDLVRLDSVGEYTFFELKVGSNTPLMAAMELVTYAVLYLFARLKYAHQILKSPNLLDAQFIHLQVLAPAPYYDGYTLSWLKESLNAGLDQMTREKLPELVMDFDFCSFPAAYALPSSSQDLQTFLQQIKPVNQITV